jgi:hypothetical protein
VADVVVGGLRVRIESAEARAAARLEPAFPGCLEPPRGQPDATLRLIVTGDGRERRDPPALPRSAARALEPALRSPASAGSGRGRRLTLLLRYALADQRARACAEPVLAAARWPLTYPWGDGTFVGDLARPCGTLLLPEERLALPLVDNALVNAHGLLLGVVAARRGGLLLHGGAAARRGAGYLFLGRSGAGKSTVCRRAGRGALSDDGALVLPGARGFGVAATPLRQTARGRRPGRVAPGLVPLRLLLVLRQWRRDALVPLGAAAIAAEILGHHVHYMTLLPPPLARRILANTAALVTSVPACRFLFTREVPVWGVLQPAGAGAPEAPHG